MHDLSERRFRLMTYCGKRLFEFDIVAQELAGLPTPSTGGGSVVHPQDTDLGLLHLFQLGCRRAATPSTQKCCPLLCPTQANNAWYST